MPLFNQSPEASDPIAIVEAFISQQSQLGKTLYPHQEEALIAIAAGDHVIAATPTGSGKTTIAYAAIFTALTRQQRAFYTAPIKALVSEKFFELVDLFGPANVGMMTGDSSVNMDAPIMVCTAEILAQYALRGAGADIAIAVLDEFHYYDDAERGWAWQVPLIELTHTQFLLMSATLGDTSFFEADLKQRTGRNVTVIANATRPVPLEFSWSKLALQETIEQLLAKNLAPIYIVNPSQRAALELATNLSKIEILTKAEKSQIKELIKDFKFAKGFGVHLNKLVLEGIGVHHAGMLPKYRRLVEKLAQSGLLKIIAGTDTLGVGINVPIRTVLLTKLTKFDGRRIRLYNSREFLQIAGRAGRAGYDTMGYVVAVPPPWALEHEKELGKFQARQAGSKEPNSAKWQKRIPKLKIPEGEVNFTKENFINLSTISPPALKPHLKMNAGILINILSRPQNPIKSLRHLIENSHLGRRQKFELYREAIKIYRGLKEAEILQVVEADEFGRTIVLHENLQHDFQITNSLAPFAIAAIENLAQDSSTLTEDTISIIEAILEDPLPVLLAQQDAERRTLLQELKAEGVDYYERTKMIEEVSWPKPFAAELENLLQIYAKERPFVKVYELSPKSVVRELYETGATFSEFIAKYRLERSEGIVLRYLFDMYRTLKRTIPKDLFTPELTAVSQWLNALIRGIDSSLVDEWEALINPNLKASEEDREIRSRDEELSINRAVLVRMVKAAMWRRVEDFAFEREEKLAELDEKSGWDVERFAKALDEYFDRHDYVVIDADAKSAKFIRFNFESDTWIVTQTIADPEGDNDFVMQAVVDLAQTELNGELELRLEYIGDLASAPYR